MTYTVINIDALSSPVYCVTHPSVRNWNQRDKSVFVNIVIGVETTVNDCSDSPIFFFSCFPYRGPFIPILVTRH